MIDAMNDETGASVAVARASVTREGGLHRGHGGVDKRASWHCMELERNNVLTPIKYTLLKGRIEPAFAPVRFVEHPGSGCSSLVQPCMVLPEIAMHPLRCDDCAATRQDHLSKFAACCSHQDSTQKLNPEHADQTRPS